MSDALTKDGIDHLHESMAARVTAGEWPGMVTCVARGDDVHVDTIGTYAFDSDEPMRRDTVFRAGSLTKPILAAATMLLVEAGALRLDEPVDRLLPELADRRVLTRLDADLDDTVPAARPITVEDLLTFRMGYGIVLDPEYNPPYPVIRKADDLRLVLAEPDPRTAYDPDGWMRAFGMLPLMHQPGETWQYNTSALVLGVLVARAAGQPLGDMMRDRVFTPLGMTHTAFHLAGVSLPAHYMTDPGSGRLERQTATTDDAWTRPPAFPSGASGLLSTVDDLLVFARMMQGGGAPLLSPASVAAVTTNHLTPAQIAGGGIFLDGQGWGYGMTVGVRDNPGRYGWDGGYGTTWFNDPASGLIAIGLTQCSDFLFAGGRDEFCRLAAQA
jgi:CubicO group peptidase (beta-lactamase class C family)